MDHEKDVSKDTQILRIDEFTPISSLMFSYKHYLPIKTQVNVLENWTQLL